MAAAEIEGFVGTVVGFVVGQCTQIRITIGAGAEAACTGVRMVMLVLKLHN